MLLVFLAKGLKLKVLCVLFTCYKYCDKLGTAWRIPLGCCSGIKMCECKPTHTDRLTLLSQMQYVQMQYIKQKSLLKLAGHTDLGVRDIRHCCHALQSTGHTDL